MSRQIHVIKNQSEYEEALRWVSELMSEDLVPGSDEERQFDLLSLVIGNYEAATIRTMPVDPVEAILFRMEQQNLKRKDLVRYIGSASKVSEVLAGKRALSLSMIRRLHDGLGIPLESLIGPADDGELDALAEPRCEFEKLPLREMFERGCFPSFNRPVKDIRDYAEELVGGLFKTLSLKHLAPAYLRANLAQVGRRKMNGHALLAWQLCVLKRAAETDLPAEYRDGSLTDDVLREIARLSQFRQGPALAQEYLATMGVALVFVRHFKKTYLDGAAMLIEGRPIIGLTLRHNRLDNFWFVLMHELVHVKRHLNSDRPFIPDDLDDKAHGQEDIEREANEGAREALIPETEWSQSEVARSHSRRDAEALARALKIHPAIVAGRVRFETGNWRLLSGLASLPVEGLEDRYA